MVALRIMRIAHSCMLLTANETTILFDPWFSDRPLYHAGEPRALSADQLPHVDAVVASHAHVDHCDLGPLRQLAAAGVPVLGNAQVAKVATRCGFETRLMSDWDGAVVRGMRITAVPARHGVPELAFIVESGTGRAYFGGDSLRLPVHDTLADRFGPIDLALLPINGLRIRPLLNRQVVMSATEAAALTARLAPRVVVPHHYAFDSGRVGNALLTKKERDPQRFAEQVRALAPATTVRILSPGEVLDVAAA